jgi:aspartate/methionine/tyrosine aminotransferase
MKIAPFALERYFAQHEFSARYLLSSSDCESLAMSDLLAMADYKTAQLWEQLKLGYTESSGHPLLRETIAGIYSEIRTEDVRVVVPEEGIFLLMHALLKPGDHVVCTFPGYQSLYEIARSIGCELSTWEPDEARGWHFDVEELQEKMRANTKLVVVNFPHNPTGYVPSREEFEAIIQIVRERGTYLLSDEMYRFLEIDEGTSLPAACERYNRAVSLFGLSKTFGLPGLRIGWLTSRDNKVLERVNELKDYTTICSSAPSEILAIIALQNRSEIIRQQVERARRNVAVLEAFFAARQDWFRWHRPIGGSVCFPRMTVVNDTASFCDQLIQETGIMLVPSSQFQFGRQHIRIGFGRDDLPEVMDRFSAYLEHRFR